MNIEEIREYCLSKPMCQEEMPFGPDTLAFKVYSKIFLLIGLDQLEDLCFNVKCDPIYALELREKYPNTVIPGYHMNKKHWNTVYAHRELPDEKLLELIAESYELIVQTIPKKLKQ